MPDFTSVIKIFVTKRTRVKFGRFENFTFKDRKVFGNETDRGYIHGGSSGDEWRLRSRGQGNRDNHS